MMALPGSAASPDLPVPAGSAPPAVAPVCVVKRFRKNPSGRSASVKRGGCANAQGDAPVEGEAPIRASEDVGSEPGEPSYQADGVPKGRASAQGDALVEGEPTIQAPKAVGSEPGEPSYQADGVPKEMGNAQSSQPRVSLRGSDPVDLVPEKPDGQPVFPEPKDSAPVGKAFGSHVQASPAGTSQARATLRGSEAEDLVPVKPDGEILGDGVGDAAPDRESASKTSSREVTTTARTKVQLGFDKNQVACGGPGHGPSGPCATGREAGTFNKASSASEATTEPTGNPLGGSAKYAQLVMSPQLEAPSGAISAFSLEVSRARKLDESSPSAKAPAVSESSGQCASAGAMVDEVRPFQRRIFMGPAGVRDVPGKVSLPEKPRVVAPLSSRPVFTGPGSIPRRTECLPKRAAAYPSSNRSDAPFLECVPEASTSLLSGDRPMPPRPPSPKRKKREPESTSRSSGSASSDEGITQDCAEAFLARLDARPTCSAGHPLFSFGSPEPGWWCSACKRVFTTRRLLWGCRVCDFDICGNCLVESQGGSFLTPAPAQNVAHDALPAVPVQDAAQEAIPSSAQAMPSMKLLRASGVLTGSDMFPDDLHLTLEVNGESLSVLGSSRAPGLKGGFRKVYHLRGEGPAASLVVKLAENDADNVNEVKSAAACPAAFTRIFGSGSIWVSLGADGLCRAHYVITERVVPLTALLDGPTLPPTACTSLALQCCRVVFRATLAGIKCRDLGQKQWGLKVPPNFKFRDEISLQQVREGLTGEAFHLVILDANCCLPVPQASLLGPRKMTSFWALQTRGYVGLMKRHMVPLYVTCGLLNDVFDIHPDTIHALRSSAVVRMAHRTSEPFDVAYRLRLPSGPLVGCATMRVCPEWPC
ncbi:unnamed protein product [Symbiodinium natans]|uniref:Uncharacterized protein n=1 Tax=Symbiodinium natans TaxID=878477 RepID=A0A812U6Q0_9DINO|nr:unnamed protein product [Symbiodinium natans]